MGQALYRKYRSKSLSEIVGQEHITDTLDTAIRTGRISHAYLFTGPHGVGKTSIARILAHQINQLPYADDSAHIDIIEIDAASNRRIDEIRELREKVYVAPTSAKYKVYIIDEVHMLTREAFNALLKTLEEPPEHVVFILATTDAHKLPETIISRTQRFTFKPIEKAKVVAHLKHIAKQEKIAISDAALALLAEHGEGSFRDSISLLDQASSHGKKVELDDVQQLLGIPPSDSLSNLVAAITTGKGPEALRLLLDLYEQGYQAAGIAKQLAQTVRSDISLHKPGLAMDKSLQLLTELIEVPASHDPERFLEITVLRTANDSQPPRTVSDYTSAAVQAAATQPAATTHVARQPAPTPEPIIEPERPKKAAKAPEPTKLANATNAIVDDALWPQILAALKQKHNTIYSIVRMARPTFTDEGLELAFAFAFHQKRINDTKSRQMLNEIIQDLTGRSIGITCILDKELATKPATAKPAAQPPAALNAISNIFGGGELLES